MSSRKKATQDEGVVPPTTTSTTATTSSLDDSNSEEEKINDEEDDNSITENDVIVTTTTKDSPPKKPVVVSTNSDKPKVGSKTRKERLTKDNKESKQQKFPTLVIVVIAVIVLGLLRFYFLLPTQETITVQETGSHREGLAPSWVNNFRSCLEQKRIAQSQTEAMSQLLASLELSESTSLDSRVLLSYMLIGTPRIKFTPDIIQSFSYCLSTTKPLVSQHYKNAIIDVNSGTTEQIMRKVKDQVQQNPESYFIFDIGQGDESAINKIDFLANLFDTSLQTIDGEVLQYKGRGLLMFICMNTASEGNWVERIRRGEGREITNRKYSTEMLSEKWPNQHRFTHRIKYVYSFY